MWNDINFQILLLEINDQDETKAFRWLFTPLECLNNRTPLEVMSDGGRERIIDILERIAK